MKTENEICGKCGRTMEEHELATYVPESCEKFTPENHSPRKRLGNPNSPSEKSYSVGGIQSQKSRGGRKNSDKRWISERKLHQASSDPNAQSPQPTQQGGELAVIEEQLVFPHVSSAESRKGNHSQATSETEVKGETKINSEKNQFLASSNSDTNSLASGREIRQTHSTGNKKEPDSRKGLFDAEDLEKEINGGFEEKFCEGNRNPDIEKEWEMFGIPRLEQLKLILKERQRLGKIVQKDWIEKKEVEKVIEFLEAKRITDNADYISIPMEFWNKGKKRLFGK